MGSFRLGSGGREVEAIQARLKALGFYSGPLDGSFGGGTEAAARLFQQSRRLKADGIVGPATWKALFAAPFPGPEITRRPLAYRCLALTASFETGLPFPECCSQVQGDFDGRGLSFGALQWSLGQGTLQPLFSEMEKRYPETLRLVFHDHLASLLASVNGGREETMAFARSIQHPVTHAVFEPWRGMFRALGRTAACRALQAKLAETLFHQAARLAAGYGLRSERALALLFDIQVQNGGISEIVRARILADFDALPGHLGVSEAETARMTIIARRRSEAARPQWIDDVRSRKLTIARGEGVVHGVRYHLEEQFGIGLKAARDTGRKPRKSP